MGSTSWCVFFSTHDTHHDDMTFWLPGCIVSPRWVQRILQDWHLPEIQVEVKKFGLTSKKPELHELTFVQILGLNFGWCYNGCCSLMNWLCNDTWSISSMRLWFLIETDGIFGAMLNMLVYQRIAPFLVFLCGTWLIIWDGCTLEHGSVCNSWRPNCWPKTPQMKVRLLANPGWQIHRNR